LQGLLDFRQNVQAVCLARPPVCAQGCPVGFVVGGFENERDFQLAGNIFQKRSDFEGLTATLDDAWPGDQEELVSVSTPRAPILID